MTDKPGSESVFDMEAALLYTDGDKEMLVTVIEVFLEEGPKTLGLLKDKIEAEDVDGIKESAHTLRGSVSIFGAQKAADAAGAVEEAADKPTVPDALQQLTSEMQRVFDELEKAITSLRTSE